MRHRFRILCAASVLAASLVGGLLATGCRDNLDETVTLTDACPDQAIFEQSVSPFLERRCGTLDCHGGIARPMRMFGQLGLRHPGEDNTSGGKATTALELSANYTSVCNVDAEKMADSVQSLGNKATTLHLVTKARGQEKHKGGKVVNEGDAGDRCILLWLQLQDAADVAAPCQEAIQQLD